MGPDSSQIYRTFSKIVGVATTDGNTNSLAMVDVTLLDLDYTNLSKTRASS